jgi:hypothetical protein
MSSHLQAEMFREARGLNVQLVYFRGLDECRASNWVTQPERLAGLMERIDCRTGITQIGKVLAHAKREVERQKVQALVFVGDSVEEDPDVLAHAAAELGRLGVPVFMFQEGGSAEVEKVYREIARLSRGASFHFDSGSAQQLAELLRAVAVYASGGLTALAARPSGGATKLLAAMKPRGQRPEAL